MKFLIGKILCSLGIFSFHKWETIGWKSESMGSTTMGVSGITEHHYLNIRIDKCKRCKKEVTCPDERAAFVKELKKMVWEERRHVIVEKHKNPKYYAYTSKFNGERVILGKKWILDEDIPRTLEYIKKFCREHSVSENVIKLICMEDDEEVPNEFL